MLLKVKAFYKTISTYGFCTAIIWSIRLTFLRFIRIIYKKPVIRTINNYKMYLDPMDPGLSSTLFVTGKREEQLKYVLSKEIKQGDTIIDLGANIGYYALMEQDIIGSSGKVYALEPSPGNFALLKKNVLLNNAQDVIELFQLAGGAKKSKEKFYLSDYSNLNTFIPKLYNCGIDSKGISDDFIMAEIIDMTTFIKNKRKIDLIRMDIEGFEVEVFEGLQQAIEDNLFIGKIVFECHFPKYDDKEHSMRKQLKMLFSNNYYPKIMTSNDEKITKFSERGYKADKLIQTSESRFQGVYYNIKPEDAEYFICDVGGVRDVLLEKN